MEREGGGGKREREIPVAEYSQSFTTRTFFCDHTDIFFDMMSCKKKNSVNMNLVKKGEVSMSPQITD